jgi:hypothetical protein
MVDSLEWLRIYPWGLKRGPDCGLDPFSAKIWILSGMNRNNFQGDTMWSKKTVRVFAFLLLLKGVSTTLSLDTKAIGQSPVITVGSTTQLAGSTFEVPIYFTSGIVDVSCLQFDLNLPAGLTSPIPPLVTTGLAAAEASKDSLAGNPKSGVIRILIYGLNQNAIGNGPLAFVRMNAGKEISPEVLSIGISGLVCSDAYANPVQASGVPGLLNVTPLGRLFMPSVVENAEMRTNLGINNLSATNANISLTLLSPQGAILKTKSIVVQPKSMTQINRIISNIIDISETNGHGSLYLDSDQPFSIWASQINNANNDPSLLIGCSSGSIRLFIPSVTNRTPFTSSLVIMNPGENLAFVTIKSYSVEGGLLSQTNTPIPIPPHGGISSMNVLADLGIHDNYGPLEINSVNGVPLMAVSNVTSTSGTSGFFEGINLEKVSLHQVIPHVIDTVEMRTNLGINNFGKQAAKVDVQLISPTGELVSRLSRVIPPQGLTQINNILRELKNPQGSFSTEGSLRLESDQPFIAWVSEIDNKSNDPSLTISNSTGTSHLLIPSVTRVLPFKSSLAIVNTGTIDADVEIRFRNIMGIPLGTVGSITVAPQGYFTSGDILGTLNIANEYGPLEIFSKNGQPLIAVSRVYSISNTSGFMVAQPIE